MSGAYDLAILGAGPAGAVAALVAARGGRRVLLLDRQERQPRRRVGEALPPQTRPLLASLGLLELVERGGHLPCYGNVSAWGGEALTATDFIRDPHGLGWHLDRPRFDADLRRMAVAAGVDLRVHAAVEHTFDDGSWALRAGSERFTARWAIDASGRSASLARSRGALRQRDDGLVALCAWVRPPPDVDHDARTLVESAACGWWYTARLPDRTRVAVLHVDAAEAGHILRTRDAWRRLVDQTVHVRAALAGTRTIVRPRAREACGARLDRFVGPGWVAVGDAALSFDPLSSQGLFNALYSGMRAGQAVHTALDGDAGGLRDYAGRLEQIRAVYLARCRAFYAGELRWRGEPFWAARRPLSVPPQRSLEAV